MLPSGNKNCNKNRSLLHSPAENREPRCVSERDCVCDYLSKAGHFSRRKDKMEQ